MAWRLECHSFKIHVIHCCSRRHRRLQAHNIPKSPRIFQRSPEQASGDTSSPSDDNRTSGSPQSTACKPNHRIIPINEKSLFVLVHSRYFIKIWSIVTILPENKTVLLNKSHSPLVTPLKTAGLWPYRLLPARRTAGTQADDSRCSPSRWTEWIYCGIWVIMSKWAATHPLFQKGKKRTFWGTVLMAGVLCIHLWCMDSPSETLGSVHRCTSGSLWAQAPASTGSCPARCNECFWGCSEASWFKWLKEQSRLIACNLESKYSCVSLV